MLQLLQKAISKLQLKQLSNCLRTNYIHVGQKCNKHHEQKDDNSKEGKQKQKNTTRQGLDVRDGDHDAINKKAN